MSNLAGVTIVFIGRSGCGKGTQSALLETFLSEKKYSVARITMGDLGRDLAKKNTVMGKWVKNILDKGGLFPSWLAGTLLINTLEDLIINDNQILIIDGSPRRLEEAYMIDKIMRDLSRPAIIPVYLDISEEEARRRLTKRSRSDDTNNFSVDARLAWFSTDVMPVLYYYGNRVITINAEGSIPAVQRKLQDAVDKRFTMQDS